MSMLLGALLLPGCSAKLLETPGPSTPPPVYTGPRFLHGTVGSMTRLRGAQPLMASGYGLVVNLRGTGSAEVPAFLRQWMINQMRKRGVGSARLGTQWMTPEQVLSSPNTAVVLVQGLIPPGATKGTQFDVLVSALPQTQTTSLEGGQLWTVDLSQYGADPSMRFSRNLAQAKGTLFLDPFTPQITDTADQRLVRQGVVLSGGTASVARKLELILNQASWQRSRLIADRINERFPKAPTDSRNTAVPVNDSLIELYPPARFARRVDQLLELIAHLYTQRGPNFEAVQAQRLADLLVADQRQASVAVLAWQAMGKTVLPVIRPYYDHPIMTVRLAALDAGARLEDEVTTDHLLRIAELPDLVVRRRAAQMLVHLPRSLRGARTLHMLLDDPDRAVRIEAYEALAAIHDPIIRRVSIGKDDRFKFALDVVPATRPMIYITQTRLPRVVLFDPNARFETPFVARLWDNRLMLRASDPQGPMAVFYQPEGEVEGSTYDVEATVLDLVMFLAHRPTIENPTDGLDFSYSEVTHVLHQLWEQGFVRAEADLQINPLAAAIAKNQEIRPNQPRPATARKELFSSSRDDASADAESDRPDQPSSDASSPVILLP